jgi:small subunit ribosomal protein S6
MRRYEEIMIIDPDATEEDRATVLERVRSLIEQQDGLFIGQDEWGMKKLAYEIRKKTRGYYVQIDFCGAGNLVSELERFFRIDERVLKYMTVLLDKEANIDQIKEELARAEAEKAAEEAAKPAETISEDADRPADPKQETTGEPEPAIASNESESAASQEAPEVEKTEEEDK